jgi:hypothetical protein
MSKWKNRFAFFEIRGRRFGVEISRVEHGGVPYLDRYILYIGGPTLRLHKFWRGDDDRAPHDHPWGFWTFPFSSYWEKVSSNEDTAWHWNKVVARTWNWRPATYRHIVYGPMAWGNAWRGVSRKPFWTFVVTTNYQRSWGFWPKWNEFVPWHKWPASQEQTDLLARRPRE